MKCPRCGLAVTDQVPRCRGCDFSLTDLDKRIRRLPERIGGVNDFAALLQAEERSQLETLLTQKQAKLGGDLVLVTVTSTRPVKPAEYVFWLFNRWRVGGEGHAGLMILVALKQRRIECEVGYGWEPLLSETASGEALEETVLPLLKDGRFYDALREGAIVLADRLEQALAACKITPPVSSDRRGAP